MPRLRLGLVWGFALGAAFLVGWGVRDAPRRGSYGWLLRGPEVMSVTPAGAAWQAGIRPGDLLRDPAPPIPQPGRVAHALLVTRGRPWSAWITARLATREEKARALL